MTRRSQLVACLTMVLLLVAPSLNWAVNGKSNQASLRGLGGVGVLVEKLAPEIEKEGLVRDKLQAEVELQLRAAGIKVLTKEALGKAPGEPVLYINVNVNTAKTEADIFPYSIDAVLLQKVTLVRGPELTTHAVTWSAGGVGSISKELVGQLRTSVEDIVDLFVRAYKAENPD